MRRVIPSMPNRRRCWQFDSKIANTVGDLCGELTLMNCRRAVDRAAVRSFSANGSDAVLRKFGVARHDRSDSPPCVRAQVAAAHAKPNQCACVKQIPHQAFSHSAESSEKRLPLTAILVPYPASGRIFRIRSIGTIRAMGRPYRKIVKETSPDSTSESIPEKLAFASFTLIVVGMIESSIKLPRSIAHDGLLCQLSLVGQLSGHISRRLCLQRHAVLWYNSRR